MWVFFCLVLYLASVVSQWLCLHPFLIAQPVRIWCDFIIINLMSRIPDVTKRLSLSKQNRGRGIGLSLGLQSKRKIWLLSLCPVNLDSVFDRSAYLADVFPVSSVIITMTSALFQFAVSFFGQHPGVFALFMLHVVHRLLFVSHLGAAFHCRTSSPVGDWFSTGSSSCFCDGNHPSPPSTEPSVPGCCSLRSDAQEHKSLEVRGHLLTASPISCVLCPCLG